MGGWLGNWEGSIFSSRAEESEHCCLLFGGDDEKSQIPVSGNLGHLVL